MLRKDGLPLGEETEKTVRSLKGIHGGHMTVTTIGKSIMGEPLWAVKIGKGTPVSLYVATHHAMEEITGRILLMFLEASLTAGTSPGTVWLVPCLNPDGCRLRYSPDPRGILWERQLRMNGGKWDFNKWQANARGVDLNHNYPTGFWEYKQLERELGIGEGAPGKYSGVLPLSENESAALMDFIWTVRPQLVLTLHAQGREMYIGEPRDPLVTVWATVLARRIGYRLAKPEGTAVYGGLTDHLATLGIPAITVECGWGENPLPPHSLGGVYREVFPLLQEAPRIWKWASMKGNAAKNEG